MVSKIFYFHPYLGKIPILTNIFQVGWNHQLDQYFLLPLGSFGQVAPWFPQKSATGLRRKSLATLETRELRDLGGQQLGILFFSGNMADIWQISMDFLNNDLYYMCIVFFSHCCPVFCVLSVFFWYLSLFGSVFLGQMFSLKTPHEKNSARLMILFGALVTRRQSENRKQGGMTPMKSSTSEVKSSIFPK